MWQSIPLTSSAGLAAARAYSVRASPMGMPNLFSLSPVVMYGWVSASMSGLTRSDTGARSPAPAASAASLSSSLADSTLKHPTPAWSACAISSSRLPTPEKTMREPGTPAASTRASSPPETMSNPEPSRPSTSMTARFEFALTE